MIRIETQKKPSQKKIVVWLHPDNDKRFGLGEDDHYNIKNAHTLHMEVVNDYVSVTAYNKGTDNLHVAHNVGKATTVLRDVIKPGYHQVFRFAGTKVKITR